MPEHSQYKVFAIETKRHNISPLVHHVVIITETSYASIEPGVIPSLETSMKAMHGTSPSDCPNYRFMEWTQLDQIGLEITLPAAVPPLPPSLVSEKWIWGWKDRTDSLHHSVSVLSCTYSAMTRYVIQKYGQEEIFQQQPAIGKPIHLAKSPIALSNNEIFLLFSRASNEHLMLHEVLHLCLVDLTRKFNHNRISKVHFPIYDPERSINILPTWCATSGDYFTELNIEIVLYDKVYISIASVTPANLGTE